MGQAPKTLDPTLPIMQLASFCYALPDDIIEAIFTRATEDTLQVFSQSVVRSSKSV